MKLSWHWSLVISIIGGLAFLFIQSRPVNTEVHIRLLEKLTELKRQHIILNEEMLKTRFGIVNNFDHLNEITRDLSANGKNVISLIEQIASDRFLAEWSEYNTRLQDKMEVTEELKSHVAVLRNSLIYFPRMTEQLSGKLSPKDADLIQKLLAQLFSLSHVNFLKKNMDIEVLLYKFEDIAKNYSGKVNRSLQVTAIHAGIIFQYAMDMNSILQESRQIQVEEALNALSNSYILYYESIQQRAAVYRTWLFIVSALLAIAFVFLVLLMRKESIALAKSNKELNFQKFALDQHAIVSISDVKGNIIYANDKFCEVSGYSREELIGVNHRIIKSPDITTEFFRDMWRIIASGQIWQGEVKNLSRNGSPYWVNSTIVPFLNDRGKPYQYVSIRTEITERKKAEMALQSATEQAEAGARAKSEFLATMSHEIRTPMNGVIGMTTLLLDTELSAEQKRFAETIQVSGEALLTIINDILDFSKLEAGHIELEEIDFGLTDLVEGVLEILAPTTYQKGVELGYLADPGMTGIFRGDQGRLRQVLMNLVGNAVKFTETGSVTVNLIKLGEFNEDYNLRVEITDTGIGIPESAQRNLFQSFTQVDASTSRRYGGTGLGLAISQRLIEAMDGQMGVDSVEGEGSTFWFELILPNLGPGPQLNAHSQSTLLSGKKMLIVAYNPVNLEFFQRSMVSWGIETQGTDDLQHAESIINVAATDYPFDLILLDCNLPGQIEAEFLHHLTTHEKTRNLPVLLTHSSSPEEWGDTQIVTLTKAQVVKPVRQSVLHETLINLFIENQQKNTIPGTSTSEEIAMETTITESRVSAEKDSENRRGLRILVAEDNPVNQLVAKGLLKKMGHSVDLVVNGLEAVEAVRTVDYDLLFMDVQMPEMDGLEATRKIRSMDEIDPGFLIVAMTANAQKSDRELCLEAGMNDYLSKPVDRTKLFELINDLFPQSE